MAQVFISHTQKDKEFCDEFDRVCARVGIRAFRSEFETIEMPAWKTIKDAINNSNAVFFLVGKELVKNQESKDPEWRYTQNWIAYEIGLACQKGIDVWAICDNVTINFPMPYINNYFTYSLKHDSAFRAMRKVLEFYNKGISFSESIFREKVGVVCPYDNCKIEFNLYAKLQPKSKIKCPQCLKDMVFPEGFPSKSPSVTEEDWQFWLLKQI